MVKPLGYRSSRKNVATHHIRLAVGGLQHPKGVIDPAMAGEGLARVGKAEDGHDFDVIQVGFHVNAVNFAGG